MNTRKIISVILKIVAAVTSLWGVALVTVLSETSFMGGNRSIMYFTIQSNLLLALAQILVLCAVIVGKKWHLPKAIGVINYLAVVSITLTFAVFCLMLAPFLPNAWSLPNLLTHVIAPVAAILDFVCFDETYFPTKKEIPLTTAPALAYLAFTIVAWNCGWLFSGNLRYPYAFLNYGGSAGVFGFSTDTSDSLFLGSFYWVLILICFVSGVGALYRWIHNKREK